MSFLFQRWLSVDSRSLRAQFGIGLLLFFAVPALAMWYFIHSQNSDAGLTPFWVVLFSVFVLMLAVAGFLLMRRGPMQVEALRGRLEGVVKDELTDSVTKAALSVANDVESINACMRVIVEELRSHIKEVEGERGRLSESLVLAEKVEGLGTMATGVAHDFNNLFAAEVGTPTFGISTMAPEAPARANAPQTQPTPPQAVEQTNKIAPILGHFRFYGGPGELGPRG